MGYSKVTGKYFYGNGDFYEFEGYISDSWGGGDFYNNQKIYSFSNQLDFFDDYDAINDTGNDGYYIITETINFYGDIRKSFHFNEQGLKIKSYFDSNSNIVLTPNSNIARYGQHGLGLGCEQFQLNIGNNIYHISSNKSVDLRLNTALDDPNKDLGLINKNEVLERTNFLESLNIHDYRFSISNTSYINFFLSSQVFLPDMKLFVYASETNSWNQISLLSLDINNGKRSFKVLDPGYYKITVDSFSSFISNKYKLEINNKLFLDGAYIPNDTFFTEQWYLFNFGQSEGLDNFDIFAPEGWKIRTSAESITVAIIDSGFDYLHPDLINNIWLNKDEIADNDIDDDGNGYIDDIRGWDFYFNDNDPHPILESNFHGTHIAGLIGAEGDNSLGIAGVAWDVKLMNLKVFSEYGGYANTNDIVESIYYAANNGADVINLSLGFNAGSYIIDSGLYPTGTFNDYKRIFKNDYFLYYNALKYASDNGVVIVASAGNDNLNSSVYTSIPADFSLEIPGMISVAAVSNRGDLSNYSNYGNDITIAAPGGEFSSSLSSNILSTLPFGEYGFASGTSMSAPLVTGAIALLLEESQGLTPEEVKAIITTNSHKIEWLSDVIGDGNYLKINNLLNAVRITNFPPVDVLISQNNFNENIKLGTKIATISSEDIDIDDVHIYEFVQGQNDNDNSEFIIVDQNLYIQTVPDYELKNIFKIRLKSTDISGFSIEKSFSLFVNNLNELITDIHLKSIIFDENISPNASIAILSSKDPDLNDTHIYTLVSGDGDSDNSLFSIDGNELKINSSPDYESKSSYNIRLKSTDSGGFSYQKEINLTLKDINEDPFDIFLSLSSFDENISPNATVATLSSKDPDLNDTHIYTLVSGDGDSDNSLFSIAGEELKINSSPDYEAKSSYNIRLETSDTSGLGFQKAFTLSVNDLDEFVPTILGTSNNDNLKVTTADDSIDGGAGIDTVTFTGKFSDYSITRLIKYADLTLLDQLQIKDKRNIANDGTDTLKNIEFLQFTDQTVEESKVDVVKTYTGNFSDYKFYSKGNGVYQIKTDSGFDDITGYPSLKFTGESETSSFRDISAIVDIKGTFDQVTGLNTDDAKMFRLYNAAFKRLPDPDGLKYWIYNYSSGINDERAVASSFLISAEFKERYGENVSNAKYVETLYTNVLGRNYDQEGYNYWLGNLNNGTETRYELLLGFSESTENKALFTEMTGFS